MYYKQQQELVANVVAQMKICADMIGSRDESKTSQYGFVPGLDESELAKSLLTRIESVKNGIFQVMFTGCFNAGKSTLINALIKRAMLRTGINPETAVITKIFFNSDEERVVIYKRDQVEADGRPSTEIMYDIDEFFDIYRVDSKDHGKFLRTVNHVEMYMKNDGIAGSMVQLVDSPGTQASTADNQVSEQFLEQANAVVFLISALAAMDQFDKKFVAEHFAKRQMKNVFFVVNRINQVTTIENIQEVKNRVREELTEVFLDEDGNFDEELFSRRVFYVNAFGALNIRLGKKSPRNTYDGEIPTEEETSVPHFEEVLGEFLTSGDKDKIALSAYRPQLASLFVAAENTVKKHRNSLNRGIEENREILEAYENDKDEIEQEINGIRRAIELTERNIMRDSKDAYDNFLDAISQKWDTYFADKKDSMQIGYFKLVAAHAINVMAFWQDTDSRQLTCDERTVEATQGFADGIKGFLDERAEDLSNEIAFKVRNNVSQLMTELNNRQKRLEELDMPIDIEEIIEKIALEKNIPIAEGNNKPNLGQAFAAVLSADPELISLAGSGNAGTKNFIIQFIMINLVDMVLATILFAIIGNIFAIILFAFYKVFRYLGTNTDLTDRLIAETKTTILEGYKDNRGNWVCKEEGKPIFTGLGGEHKATYINKVSSVINGVMRRTGNQLVEGINGSLAEVEENLKKTNDLLANNENILRLETVRFNKILNAMATAISEMSRLTNGKTLTRDEIRDLAVSIENR